MQSNQTIGMKVNKKTRMGSTTDGEWEAPKVENPSYQGKWEPRKIANPEYFEETNPF